MSPLPIMCVCGHTHETDGNFGDSCSDAACSCTRWRPLSSGGAVAADGTDLVLFTAIDGTSRIGFGPDGEGPYHQIAGCPNCGKLAGEWYSGIAFAAASNSGIDFDGPCSRACRYQLEWQAEIAASELTEGAPA